MGNKMTLSEKELVLQGLEELLIRFTTKCDGSYRYEGLCAAICDVYVSSYILHKSYIGYLLSRYIKSNPPMFIAIRKRYYNAYWWKKFSYEPRIKYLRKHIKKLKEELGYGK